MVIEVKLQLNIYIGTYKIYQKDTYIYIHLFMRI